MVQKLSMQGCTSRGAIMLDTRMQDPKKRSATSYPLNRKFELAKSDRATLDQTTSDNSVRPYAWSLIWTWLANQQNRATQQWPWKSVEVGRVRENSSGRPGTCTSRA